MIEMLVALSLMAILAVAVLGAVNFQTQMRKSRDTKRRADIAQVRSALEMFRADNTSGEPAPYAFPFAYPRACNGVAPANSWSCLDTTLRTGGYLSVLPSDPQPGKNYYYTSWSLGTDTKNIYTICARLEQVATGDPACPSVVSCGAGGNCNYGFNQP